MELVLRRVITFETAIMIRDEIDGAPTMLKSGEGNWLKVSFARTNAWGARKKIFDFSTPTVWGESQIQEEYDDGDQRKFLVPCPHCETYQELELTDADAKHGLRADYKAGILERVYYLCDHCNAAIFNHHKTGMMIKGRWEPSARSSVRNYRSYHISSLYSPVGMLSWMEFFERYLKA